MRFPCAENQSFHITNTRYHFLITSNRADYFIFYNCFSATHNNTQLNPTYLIRRHETTLILKLANCAREENYFSALLFETSRLLTREHLLSRVFFACRTEKAQSDYKHTLKQILKLCYSLARFTFEGDYESTTAATTTARFFRYVYFQEKLDES